MNTISNRAIVRLAALAASAAALVAGPAAATDKSDVMAVLHQFVDGFNQGDLKSALAACADDSEIIDEFPPYEWHGPGACATWAGELAASDKQQGITDEHVSLGTTRHIDVTADRAYVVETVNYSFNVQGKPGKEIGSIVTLGLHKEAAGWRIVAWSWAKH
jgi:ketosteroid isomerase-like protein